MATNEILLNHPKRVGKPENRKEHKAFLEYPKKKSFIKK